jgi:serine/threonine kinase 38
MEELSLPEEKKEQIKETILHKESEGLREDRKKESIADFDLVKVIGKGAFGEVRLYNWKKNNQPVAIKRMIKSEMIFKNKMLQAQV